MTSYDQLPVYKASFDLLITISTSVKSFPREYKYTFGERLQNAALDTVTEITLAALGGGDKFFHLEHAKKSVETLKILRRASHAIDLLSHNQYTDLLFLLSSVSRQLLGREKSVLGG